MSKPQKEENKQHPVTSVDFISGVIDVCLFLLQLVWKPFVWIIRGIVYVLYGLGKIIWYSLRIILELLGEILEAIFTGW